MGYHHVAWYVERKVKLDATSQPVLISLLSHKEGWDKISESFCSTVA